MQNNVEVLDKIDFRGFNKAFFADRLMYQRLSNKAKEEHFFILCRTLSKLDPVFINKFQDTKHWTVVDFLHQKYYEGRIPQYVYVSMKQAKVDKLEYQKYSDDVLNYVMELTGYEYKSIILLCKMMPLVAKDVFKNASNVVKGKLSQRKK